MTVTENQRPPHIGDQYPISDTTYKNYGCLCDGCNDAHKAAHKKWRDSASGEMRQKMTARANKRLDRINEESRADATNTGKPWTDEDMAVVADPSITTRQAAQILGRGLYAVKTRRYQYRKEQRSRPPTPPESDE